MKTIILVFLAILFIIISLCEAKTYYVVVTKKDCQVFIDSFESITLTGDHVLIRTKGEITIISEAPIPASLAPIPKKKKR